MLSPLGNLIININNQNPISTAENLEFKEEDNIWDATLPTPSPVISKNAEELDLEDLISTPNTNGLEELSPSNFSTYLTIEAKDGTEKRVHKACALKALFQDIVHEVLQISRSTSKDLPVILTSQLVPWTVLRSTTPFFI